MELTQKRIVLLAVALLIFVAIPLFGGMTGNVWLAAQELGECKGGGCKFARLFMGSTLIGWGLFLAAATPLFPAALIVGVWAA